MSNIQTIKLIVYLFIFVWIIGLPILTGVMARRKNRSFGRWFIFSLFSSFLVPGLIPGSIVGMLMLYILPVVERKDVPSEKLKSFFGQEIKPAAFLVYLLVLSFSCFSLLMFAIKFNKSLPWLSQLIQRSEIIVPALNSNVMNYHLITFNLSIYMFFALLVYQAIILAKKQFNRHLDLYLQLSVTVIWMFSLISGSIWSNEAWGSYWRWDPRETWCLITAGTFMQAGMLHFTGRIIENSKRGYLVVFSFNIMAFLILLFTKFGPGLFFSSLYMGL